MSQLKKCFITSMLLVLISFSTVSVVQQVTEAKIPSNYLESLDDGDDDIFATGGNDFQSDSSVSAQKQPIETDDIADNAITSPKIKDGEVMTSDIANGAVTKEKLDPNAVKLVVHNRGGLILTVDPHSVDSKTVECESGEIPTGGGFTGALGVDSKIYRSQRSGNGWEVGLENTDDVEASILVYAECAHLE